MNASSQTPQGAMPLESPHGPQPLAASATPAGMFAAYGAVVPVPTGLAGASQQAAPAVTPAVPAHLVVAGPEPATPQCYACQGSGPWVPCPRGRRYPSGAQALYCRACVPDSPVVEAASGVITAAMEHGHSTVREWAQAEEDAGLLADPQRMKDIAVAAIEQARAELRADLAQAEQDREALDWFHARWQSIQALVAGRPDSDLILVSEFLKACTPEQSTGAPLTVAWDGLVAGPAGDRPGERTIVGGTTARGGRAVLVLDDRQRLQLGERLLATVHTAEACQTAGCGMEDEDLDPTVPGSVLVQVAGTDGPARWWCSVWCANSAITAAGAELAAADQAAAVDPAAQAPLTALHRFEPERLGESDAKRRVARCRHCSGARTDAVHTWADDDQAAVGGGL